MIRLYVLDIDGCITYPFVTPPWNAMTRIRELSLLSREDETIPQLALCTGRPYPYAEAVAQYLDIKQPVVFESGGGLFDPVRHGVEFSPHFDNKALKEKREISDFVENEVLPDYSTAHLEFTKYTDVGIVGNDEKDIREMYAKVKDWVEPRYPNVEVHTTEVSVNVIRKACNKGEGLKHISRYTGISCEEMAYIGDSSGDLTAMRIAGHPIAPANAIEEVKKAAGRTLSGEATHAVLEGYELFVEHNRALTTKKAATMPSAR